MVDAYTFVTNYIFAFVSLGILYYIVKILKMFMSKDDIKRIVSYLYLRSDDMIESTKYIMIGIIIIVFYSIIHALSMFVGFLSYISEILKITAFLPIIKGFYGYKKILSIGERAKLIRK